MTSEQQMKSRFFYIFMLHKGGKVTLRGKISEACVISRKIITLTIRTKYKICYALIVIICVKYLVVDAGDNVHRVVTAPVMIVVK